MASRHNGRIFHRRGSWNPLDLIERAFQSSASFFQQSQAKKEAQSPFAKNLNSGYEYFSQVRPSTGTADQKESLQITAHDGVMDGRWPERPADFRTVSNELLECTHALAGRILDLLEPRACPDNNNNNNNNNTNNTNNGDKQQRERSESRPSVDVV
jgi:isopenicillin N synthase-like dioxygenase